MAILNCLSKNIPVLCYHDIGSEGGQSLKLFEEHLQVIKEMNFTSISAKKLYQIITREKKIAEKYIVLTFDDGHISNWLHVIPLLKKYNLKGIFFVITDFIIEGKKRTLNDIVSLNKLSNAFRSVLISSDYSQFMNMSELKSIIEDYGMEVYAHSSRHTPCFISLEKKDIFISSSHWGVNAIYSPEQKGLPVFPIGSAYVYNGYWPVKGKQTQEKYMEIDGVFFRKRTTEERYNFCMDDFKRCYEKIRTINKSELQFFCWPWGHFDKVSLQAIKDTGFQGAFTLERFYNGPGSNPFRICRIGVGKKKTGTWLRNRLLMHSTSIGSRLFFKFFRKKVRE